MSCGGGKKAEDTGRYYDRRDENSRDQKKHVGEADVAAGKHGSKVLEAMVDRRGSWL